MTSITGPYDRFAASISKLTGWLRILLVEDDQDAASHLEMLLRLEGHGVHVAPDGEVALQVAADQPPDVVLLDLGLPGMDGYEVARRLCTQHRGKRPLIVAVTGQGSTDDRRCGREAGIDYHFVKPVDLEALKDLLSRFQDFIIPVYP